MHLCFRHLYRFYGAWAYCRNTSVRSEFGFYMGILSVFHSVSLCPLRILGLTDSAFSPFSVLIFPLCISFFFFFFVGRLIFKMHPKVQSPVEELWWSKEPALLAARAVCFKMVFSCENLISELTAHPATYIFDQNGSTATRVCGCKQAAAGGFYTCALHVCLDVS